MGQADELGQKNHSGAGNNTTNDVIRRGVTVSEEYAMLSDAPREVMTSSSFSHPLTRTFHLISSFTAAAGNSCTASHNENESLLLVMFGGGWRENWNVVCVLKKGNYEFVFFACFLWEF